MDKPVQNHDLESEASFLEWQVKKQAARNERRDATYDFGTNPCVREIILRPYQFCNLSEVVVRSNRYARRPQTKSTHCDYPWNSTGYPLTDFRYLRNVWKVNTEEEALLGVSLTGIMDHPMLSGRGDKNELKKWLRAMRSEAVKTNEQWAKRLGINVLQPLLLLSLQVLLVSWSIL